MTPVSLNPPPPNSLLHQPDAAQNGQFINFSPINQDPPTFFNLFGGNHDHHQDHDKLEFHQNGSSPSNDQQLYNSSSSEPSSARDTNLSSSLEEDSSKNSGHGCEKWMSSKMRLMKKMMNSTAAVATTIPMMRPSNNADKSIINENSTAAAVTTPVMNPSNYQSQTSPRSNNNNSGNNFIRVCSDCKTSSTPLWRSGPMGPKSLCNACGIRQRKARRAMAEAAEAEAGLATSTKARVHNKEKKPRVNKLTQFKKKNKSITTTAAATTSAGSSSEDVKNFESYALNLRNNSDFEDMFSSDEATEAALLLMDISSAGKLFALN